MYWTNDSRFSGGEQHGGAWSSKKDAVIWRGTASGGRNREDTWHRFQRHRFVAMMNSTFLPAAESTADHEATRKLDNMLAKPWHYDLAVSSPQTLADWIAPWSDVAMMSLNCFPGEEKGQCTYTAPYYQLADDTPMSKQYGYKYLPDIDGNSFSGRYRAFMASTSLVIKATIYQEWHDSRLIPWRHFVPMDNTFIDIYGIMEYFIGNSERGLKAMTMLHRRLLWRVQNGRPRFCERKTCLFTSTGYFWSMPESVVTRGNGLVGGNLQLSPLRTMALRLC